MAKSKKFELDDYGFSSDLNVPDFNFNAPEIRDDRKPVTKFKDSVLKGAKDTAVSPAFIRRVIKQSLPRGYGQAMDLADQSAGTLKSLYNTTTRELKPALNDLKRTTDRIMPAADKVLPRKVSERIKKWTQSADKQAGVLSADAQRESSIQMQLGDIFKFQAEESARQETQNDIKDKIKQGIELSRHRDQLAQLDSIRTGIERLTTYQDKVTAQYHRKSLELQFRHYFVAMDMLEEQKKLNAVTQSELEAIKKNTGLPDFVKLKQSEALKEVMRNRFMESLNDGLFGKRRDFIKNLGEKLSGTVKNKLSNFTTDVRGGLDAANMMLDMHDMQKEMGAAPSGVEMLGNLAGGAMVDSLGKRVGKRIGRWAGKNKKIVQGGNRLAYLSENLPQIAAEWAKGNAGESGFGSGLVRFGKDLVNDTLSGPDTSLNVDRVSNLQAPSVYSRHANKSITEIIPGFLARIYQELQIIRTGDSGIELTTYDYNANKFSKASAVKKAAFGSLFRSGDKESTKDDIERLLDQLDPTGKKLSPEQRKVLGKYLLDENANNRLGSKERLTDAFSYGGKAGKHGGAFADLFTDYFGNDHSGTKQLEFSREYNRLGSGIDDSRKLIQDYVNAGQTDFLLESGIIDARGNINLDKLREYHYEGDYNPAVAHGDGKVRRGGMRQRSAGTTYRPTASKPQSANYRPNFDTRGLINAINSLDIRSIEEASRDALLRIEQRLNAGLITVDGSQLGIGTAVPASRWYNQSLKQLSGNLWQKGVAGVNHARNLITGAASKAMSFGSGLFHKGLDMATTFGKQALNKAKGIYDVYIQGEAIPRLTAWKLKAGMYRDQLTGRVIKSYKDIAGAVVDENGNIVLTAEEAKKAFVKFGPVKKTIEAMGAVVKLTKDFGNKVLTQLPIMWQLGLKTTKALYDVTLFRAEDVYVKGRPDPVLLARAMRAGYYHSKYNLSKTINHPGDIDGPVVDNDGNVVLTEDDIKMGLVDKNGKPLRVGFAKLAGMAKDAMMSGFNALRTGAAWLKDTAAGALSGIGGFFGKLIHKDGILFAGSKTIVDRLTEIRDLLDQRLPKRKKVAGDIDGDGIREGSYEDIMRHRTQAADAKRGSSAAPQQAAATGGGLMALINRLRGRNKTQDGDADGTSSSGIDINLGGGGAGGKTPGIPKSKTPVPKGFMAKTGHYAKAVGRGLWGATKWGGKALLALSGLSSLAELGIGAGLLGTAGSALAATGGAIVSGAGMLASGVGAVAAAAASVLSAPVILGAAAIAALGVGGYYAYKYLTRKKLDTMSKVRYAQYGFLPTDNDHFSALMKLEDQLEKVVTWSGSQPDIDGSKVQLKDLLSPFEVDPENEIARARWLQWFTGRFKPVYLTHLAALKATNPEKGLGDVEGLKIDEKKKYFNLSKFSDGPYNVLISPFANEKQLAAGKAEVDTVIQSTEAELEKESKDDKSKTVPEAATAGATAATVSTMVANMSPSSTTATTSSSGVKTGVGAMVAAGGLASLGSVNSSTTIMATFGGFERAGAGKLDALTCIRYKTYGLTEMVIEKVRALDMLETAVKKNISFSGKGSASWSGSIDAVLAQVGPAFGIDGTANDKAYAWQTWFNLRFLPVFLNYATAIKSQTNKEDISTATNALNAQQMVDVAMVVYTTNNSDGTSAWKIDTSPWPGYALNTDVTTVERNMQGLKEVAKKSVLEESRGTKDKAGLGADNGMGVVDGTAGKKGFLSSVKDAASSAWQSTKSAFTKAGSWLGGVLGGSKDSGTSTPSMGGGRTVSTAGKGDGGAVDSLPQPKTKGTWAGVKDLIMSAAKMVGVDGKLMATMAAIESGFDWTVKAGTSSATGLYQFISSTWNTMLRKYGSKYGIAPGTSPTDPRANALMGAEYMRENAEALQGALQRPLTDTDLYIAHFLGAGGAKKFLTASPTAIAADLLPGPARSNPAIFYRDGRALTVAEVYALINDRVRKKGKQFGIDDGSEEIQSASTSSNAPAGGIAPNAGPVGTFPVIDQAPGITVDSGRVNAPPGTMPNMPLPSASSAVPPDVAAAGSGFAPTPISERAQSLKAQSQAQQQSMADMFGPVGDTLQKSLQVQTNQFQVMMRIYEILAESQGKKAEQVSMTDNSEPARPMPTAPISMTKAINSF